MGILFKKTAFDIFLVQIKNQDSKSNGIINCSTHKNEMVNFL